MTSEKNFNKIQRSVGKKGSENTEELSKALMEELNCETAFTIPVFGGIPVAESVVVTWVIMAVLLVAAFFLGRNLRVENAGKRQLAVETVVGGLHNFFYDLLGEEGKRYIPYLMTVGIYIAVANMIGLFGLKSPTKDVGVTGALALMSICKRNERFSEEFRRTDTTYVTNEYIGDIYSSIIIVYASFW